MGSSFSFSKNHILFLHYDNLASNAFYYHFYAAFLCACSLCLCACLWTSCTALIFTPLVAIVHEQWIGYRCWVSTELSISAKRVHHGSTWWAGGGGWAWWTMRTIMMLWRTGDGCMYEFVLCGVCECKFIVILCTFIHPGSRIIITRDTRWCAPPPAYGLATFWTAAQYKIRDLNFTSRIMAEFKCFFSVWRLFRSHSNSGLKIGPPFYVPVSAHFSA